MGLVGWWPLNGNLDDISGNENHLGYIYNTSKLTSVTSGKIGSAYQRASINDGADAFRADAQISLPFSFTMACWAYVTGAGTSANGLVTNHNHNTNSGAGITVKYITDTDYRISCNTGSGTSRTYYSYYGTSNIKDRWAHLLLRFDRNTNNLTLWVDGIKEFENTYAMASPPDYLDIFNWSTSYVSSASYRPAAKLNDVRIYDHALSDKEIYELSRAKVLHYTFDDFQEPTENLLMNVIDLTFETTSGVSAYSTIEATDEVLFNGHKVYKVNVDSDASGFNITSDMWVPGDTLVSMSFWVYIPSDQVMTRSWELHRHALPDNVCLGGSCHHYTAIDYTNKDWNNSSPKNQWFKREIIIKTHNDDAAVYGYITRIFAYSGSGAADGYFYVTEPQIEVKDHSTPFTESSRQGIIRDISGYGNDATLSLATTPKWSTESRIGSGAYEFFGINEITTNKIFHDNTNQCHTVSAWIYPKLTLPIDGSVVSSKVINFNQGYYIEYYSNYKTLGYLNGGVNDSYVYGNILARNQWTLITWVIDTATQTCRVYYNGTLHASSSNYAPTDIPYGFAASTVLGSNFTGLLDDVRVYATALSADDIKALYESRASLDDKGNLMLTQFAEDVEPTVNLIAEVIDPATEKISTSNEFMQYCDLSPIFDKYGSGPDIKYSLSLDLKTSKAGTNNMNVYMQSGSGTEYNFVSKTVSVTQEYQRYYFENLVATPTGSAYITSYLAFYGTYGTQNYPAVKNVQVELKDHCTPFTDGSRYQTDNLPLTFPYGANTVINSGIAAFNNFSEVGPVNGLIGWWKLDGNANDYSVNRAHGTVNSATVTPGLGQLAYTLDGVDDYINVPIALSDHIMGTISVWYYPESFYNYNTLWDVPSNADDWECWIYADGILRARLENAYVSQDLNALGGAQKWYHIVFTWSQSGNLSLYVDGVLRNTAANTTWVTSGASVSFGGNNNTKGTGKIQDVRIYNRALTDEEVGILYGVTGTKSAKMKIAEDGTVYVAGKFKEV